MNPLGRFKRPDKKNALSIIESAKKDIVFTLKIKVSEESAATIVRNIYESFRKLGDALLLSKGIESHDHIMPINELISLRIQTKRPLRAIENLRQLRHNLNYYGYEPTISEVLDVIDLAKSLFNPLYFEVKKIIEK